jgi:hypothetical protein
MISLVVLRYSLNLGLGGSILPSPFPLLALLLAFLSFSFGAGLGIGTDISDTGTGTAGTANAVLDSPCEMGKRHCRPEQACYTTNVVEKPGLATVATLQSINFRSHFIAKY